MAERKRPPPAHRRCPACSIVRPAAGFRRATGKRDFGPLRPTRCPVCSHVGQFQTFMRSDPPLRAEEGEG